MAKLAAYPEPMDVEQFLAFNDTRPDKEKWELLDGELFLNATPVNSHQIVVDNLVRHLHPLLRAAGNRYRASTGTGVRLSDITLVEPDVMVRPRHVRDGNVFEDIVVAFEVLSQSTRRNDLKFKRTAYAALASLTHYVAIAPRNFDVRVFARSADWAEVRLSQPEQSVAFDSLGISLPLAAIYDDMADFMTGPQE